MKNTLSTLTIFLSLLLLTQSRSAAQTADVILGKWLTEGDKSIVEVWKANGAYQGKIVWIKDSLENGKPKVDKFNPIESRRKQPALGLQILSHLKFNNNEWVEGTIYDPENGKEYSCKATMNGEKLDLRGYVLGLPFLGRTTTWRRVP